MSLPPKDKVLADVGVLVRHGTLTLQELRAVYVRNAPAGAPSDESGSDVKGPASVRSGNFLATALYVVGTLIVCIGIYLLIAQNWSEMNTPVRIAVTVGLGLLLFGIASRRTSRGHDANRDLLTACLFTIAATALTIGTGVVAHEAGASLGASGTITALALITSGIFVAVYFLLVRSLMILLFAIGLAIAAYYAGLQWMTHTMTLTELFYAVETMVVGALLVGAGFVARTRALVSRLTNLFYEFGMLLFLSAPFWLTLSTNYTGGGQASTSKIVYDVLYPLVLVAGVWLSVYAKSRSVLVITALFLTAYIFEISFEYFSEVLGGSIALCLAGVLVMGMAYGATRFAKRFIAKP